MVGTWFFLGGTVIAIFLVAVFIIDVVYSYRIWNNSNFSSGEGVFLVLLNLLGLILALSIVFMFTFKILTRGRFQPVENLAKEMTGQKEPFGRNMGERDDERHHGDGCRSSYRPECRPDSRSTRSMKRPEFSSCYTRPPHHTGCYEPADCE